MKSSIWKYMYMYIYTVRVYVQKKTRSSVEA